MKRNSLKKYRFKRIKSELLYVVKSKKRISELWSKGKGGRTSLPWAFTEQGIYKGRVEWNRDVTKCDFTKWKLFFWSRWRIKKAALCYTEQGINTNTFPEGFIFQLTIKETWKVLWSKKSTLNKSGNLRDQHLKYFMVKKIDLEYKCRQKRILFEIIPYVFTEQGFWWI